MSLIVNLDVPDDVILSRISDRWVHLPSGRVYNLSYNPPKVAGHDDETGEPLIKRPDDNPVCFSSLTPHPCVRVFCIGLTRDRHQEIFARRLEQFYASTSPLLAYYGAAASADASTKLVTLAGRTSDEIWPQLESVIRSNFPSVKERMETKRRNSLSDAVLARRDQDVREKAKATGV